MILRSMSQLGVLLSWARARSGGARASRSGDLDRATPNSSQVNCKGKHQGLKLFVLGAMSGGLTLTALTALEIASLAACEIAHPKTSP